MLVQTSFPFISQVMSDLHLRNWTADQRATGYDQELLAQYQSQFCSIETAAAEPEGRVPADKKKKEACQQETHVSISCYRAAALGPISHQGIR